MILHDDHLYILCGTNSWIYNSDVYDIYLPELKCQHIGSTFDEIEDPSENGRYKLQINSNKKIKISFFFFKISTRSLSV